MTTIFIAVQCVECSTMQVKQQSKRGNKWACVVCNQKQSVRKVFAQGPMARDLRKFVQNFNMSRKFIDEQVVSPQLDEGIVNHEQSLCRMEKKRRSDWGEYLDLEENCNRNSREQTNGEDGEFEGKIVTELQGELFKKPKSADHPRGSYNGRGDEFFEPAFSKRKTTGKHTSSHEELTTKKTSNWSRHLSQDNKETRCFQNSDARAASKWSKYIDEDVPDWQPKSSDTFADEENQESAYILETLITNEEKVEEFIHPDFRCYQPS